MDRTDRFHFPPRQESIPGLASTVEEVTSLFPGKVLPTDTSRNKSRRLRDSRRDVLSFLMVAAYLSCVLLFLVATRRLNPQVSARRLLWGSFKRRLLGKRQGTLREIRHDGGHCFIAPIDSTLPSDADSVSWVMVYEDGKPLPRPHSPHEQIRQQGGGAFSHWDGAIFFSTPDNSDPRTNQRSYRFVEVQS